MGKTWELPPYRGGEGVGHRVLKRTVSSDRELEKGSFCTKKNRLQTGVKQPKTSNFSFRHFTQKIICIYDKYLPKKPAIPLVVGELFPPTFAKHELCLKTAGQCPGHASLVRGMNEQRTQISMPFLPPAIPAPGLGQGLQLAHVPNVGARIRPALLHAEVGGPQGGSAVGHEVADGDGRGAADAGLAPAGPPFPMRYGVRCTPWDGDVRVSLRCVPPHFGGIPICGGASVVVGKLRARGGPIWGSDRFCRHNSTSGALRSKSNKLA